jgi:hypothetical protein
MSDSTPRRPNPDRKAARSYRRSQEPPHIPTTGPDPNAQFLGEQSLAGGGGWFLSIHRLMRRLIVGRGN